MRLLTVISGVIMAAAGAFSCAFYMNGYAGVALVLGLAACISGICNIISYGIGFRKSLLTETVLVEGLFSLVLGFLAVASLIPEGSVLSYYGIWMCICGLCRFSESLAVSKINPRNWFAVMPLGIVNALIGFVMAVPELGNQFEFDSVFVIAVCYIMQGFSIAVYALYMVNRAPSQKTKEAKERAEAKKKLADEKRRERDRQRRLSEDEREAERERLRIAKVKEAEEKAAERAAKKEQRRAAGEHTMEFTAAETAEIKNAADGTAVDAAAESAAAEDDEPIKAGDIWESPAMEEEELVTRPVFNKPVNIPTIEKAETREVKTDSLKVEEKRAIVNLEEIENKQPKLELPKVELPKVELKSEGGESHKRKAFLLELEEEAAPEKEEPEDLASFTPLSLEELFADERFNIKPLTDKRSTDTDLKLTQTFTFDWLDLTK